jgi:hypothetical protein
MARRDFLTLLEREYSDSKNHKFSLCDRYRELYGGEYYSDYCHIALYSNKVIITKFAETNFIVLGPECNEEYTNWSDIKYVVLIGEEIYIYYDDKKECRKVLDILNREIIIKQGSKSDLQDCQRKWSKCH